MLLSLLMLLKPQNAILKLSFKIIIISVLVFAASTSFFPNYELVVGMSVELKICLLVALAYYSL